MNVIDYIVASMAQVNLVMIQDVKPLTPAQLAWKPQPGANSIGFIFWHYMRAEDNVLHGIAKKPAVWEDEKWYEKYGMDAKRGAAGFTPEQVDAVSALPLALHMAYAERVARTPEECLRTLSDAQLLDLPDPVSHPHGTHEANIRSFLVGHGWWHIGEIKYLKGLQGMPFFK